MKDLEMMEKEFKELEKAIDRLEEVERELGELKPPGEVFDSRIESLRAKLRQPRRVDEVEKELTALQQQIRDYGSLAAQPTTKPEEPMEPTPPPPSAPRRQPASTFPPELDELYSDAILIGSGGFARVFRARSSRPWVKP